MGNCCIKLIVGHWNGINGEKKEILSWIKIHTVCDTEGEAQWFIFQNVKRCVPRIPLSKKKNTQGKGHRKMELQAKWTVSWQTERILFGTLIEKRFEVAWWIAE